MLELKKIKISNYYSIGEVELPFENGLHYIVGENKDIESMGTSSNGAGKTAVFSGIYQGLYNKNIKNPKGTIESVNNSITGKPYSISISLHKQGHGDFTITNDRNTNKIEVTKDGKEVQVKGIVNQLKQIRDIIGLDYETFSALTYISQSTLQAILDTTNKDNILFQFFNIDNINKAESALKEERKELKNTRNILLIQARGCEKNISILMGFEKVDINELEGNLKILTDSLLALTKDKRHTQVKMLMSSIGILKEKRAGLTSEKSGINFHVGYLRKQFAILSSDKCPTCDSDLTGRVINIQPEIDENEQRIEGLDKVLTDINTTLKSYEEIMRGLEDSIKEEENNIVSKINQIKSKLLVVAEQNSQYDKIKNQKDEIEKELSDIFGNLKQVDIKLEAIEHCLHFIKNGTLVNEYLNKFRKVFSSVLKELTQKTDFTISINVSVSSGKLNYRFFDRGVEKGFNDLSAGEKTRVSLLLLISTIFTLEKVTGFSSNYLVLDELLGVLDEEGIEMVKKFLNIMREEKAVFLITHHNEIPVEFFDSVITFTKEKGITTLQKGKI